MLPVVLILSGGHVVSAAVRAVLYIARYDKPGANHLNRKVLSKAPPLKAMAVHAISIQLFIILLISVLTDAALP